MRLAWPSLAGSRSRRPRSAFGRSSLHVGRRRPKVGRNQSNTCRHRPNFSRHRPEFGRKQRFLTSLVSNPRVWLQRCVHRRGCNSEDHFGRGQLEGHQLGGVNSCCDRASRSAPVVQPGFPLTMSPLDQTPGPRFVATSLKLADACGKLMAAGQLDPKSAEPGPHRVEPIESNPV